MNRVMVLTKFLLKNTFSEMNAKMSSGQKVALVFAALIGFLPLMVVIYFMAYSILQTFQVVNQLDFGLAIFFNVGILITFFFAVLSIPALYYFSNDIESLIPLPFKSWELVFAKFVSALVFEYGVVAFVLIPTIIAYVNLLGFDIHVIIGIIVGGILMPVAPVVYASIIVMVLMRFSRFFANKERFNLIAGLFAIGFAIGIQFINGAMQQSDPNDLIQAISKPGGLIDMMVMIFPQIIWLAKFIVNGEWMYIIFFVIFHIGIFMIFMVIAQKIYLIGVLNIVGLSAKKKKLTDAELHKSSKSRSSIISYIKQEFRELFRSSTYLVNNVIAAVLLPILLLVIFMANGTLKELGTAIPVIDFSDTVVINIFFIAGIANGILNGSVNGISTTAISRRGQNFFFVKIIPMCYKDQLLAMLVPGIILGWIGSMIMVGIAVYALATPIVIIILLVIASTLGVVLINIIDMLIGILKPKLDWTTEAQVSKNSMVAFLGSIAGMSLAASVFLLLFVADIANIILISSIVVVVLAVSYFIYIQIVKTFIKFTERF